MSGGDGEKPRVRQFRFSDDFANHSFDLHDYSARPLPDDVARRMDKLSECGAFSIDLGGAMQEAEGYMRGLGMAALDHEYGSEEYRQATSLQLSRHEGLEHLSRDWYLFRIYMADQRLAERRHRLSLGEADPPREGDGYMVFLAIQLGAICREYQLSAANKAFAVQGRRDAKWRSEGGKTRKHPDREQILAAMQRRIEGGQSIAQAARATFEVDGLGSSADANASLWKRAQR